MKSTMAFLLLICFLSSAMALNNNRRLQIDEVGNGTCLIDNCDICSEGENQTCEKCSTGFEIQDDACVSETVSPTDNTTNITCGVESCTTCVDGDSTTCSQCEEGFSKVNGQCLECEADSCAECVLDNHTECKTCFEGWTLEDGRCQRNIVQSSLALTLGLAIPLGLVLLATIVFMCVKGKSKNVEAKYGEELSESDKGLGYEKHQF